MKIVLSEQQVREFITIALISRGNGRVTPDRIKFIAKTVIEQTGEQRTLSLSVEIEA